MRNVSLERVVVAGCLLAVAGCRCDPPVSSIPLGFRVDVGSLDFGRVLEGDTKELVVTLTAETRAAVTVAASVGAPFEVPAQVEVQGASDFAVTVRFHAGDGPANGVLVFTAHQKTLKVPLTGLGVRPLVCVPSGPCLRSAYELEGDRCVETPAPDESRCDTGDVCLVDGRCRAAQCVGVAPDCKDKSVCTADACAPGTGCVHPPIACPAPTAPCKVATCDPLFGCGVGDAPDGTICGAVSCAEAHLCVLGQCLSVVPPDGFPCLPAVACLPAATCKAQQCVRPDAGPWLPAWSTRLQGVPQLGAPALLTSGGQLYLTVCGVPTDGGLADAGVVDAGVVDAGVTDGGVPDGGVPDGGVPDGGVPDGGVPDGGVPDGGVPVTDAGLTDAGGADGGVPDAGVADDGGSCALASYTGTGYQRFTTTFDDRQPRQLLSAEEGGVVLLGAGGLSVHSRTTGSAVASVAVPGAHLRGVATLSDGGVLLAAQTDDGGAALATWTSLGLEWGDALLGPDALVAIGLDDRAHTFEPDAGVYQQGSASAALVSRLPSLVVSQGVALVGGQHLVTVGAGGPTVVDVDWSGDGGPYELLSRQVLAASGTADVFFLRCDPLVASCLPEERGTWVRAFDLASGAQRWEAMVAPGGVPTKLVGAALLGQSPGAVVTVLQQDLDGGPRASLRVFSLGGGVMACPLSGVQALSAVAFGPGQLFVLGVDGDGGARLEGYDAPGVVLPTTGWAQDDGLAGSRREAP